MSRIEDHPSDEGKYQSTFDSYGHGEGNGKSKTAIYKHYKTFKKKEEEKEEVIVDDSTLSATEKKFDDLGNKTIQYNYTDEDGKPASEIMYLSKPRKEPGFKEGVGPKMPSDRPIEEERFYTKKINSLYSKIK